MTEWIISDTHFGHHNIIKYCSRPFQSVNRMDATMILRWQERVKPEDTIYHIGDVGLTKGDFLEKRILPCLPGKKILILGNHDKSAKRMMEIGFDFACEGMFIRPAEWGSVLLFLSHKPLRTKPNFPGVGYPDYVLHGHIHNSTSEERAKHESKGEIVEIPSFNINMSVELWDYQPVSLVPLVKKRLWLDKPAKHA